MNDKNITQWGFNKQETKVANLFKMLPIYPQVTTRKELKKKLGVNSTKLGELIRALPSESPVFEDDKEISRLK